GAGADGVPMGKWVAEGRSGGITMGFYDGAASPVQWRLADEFVLLDHYFQSVHGGSFANHYFLITAGIAHVGDDPDHRAVAGPDGTITKDGEVSPDGYVVNNLDPPYPPQRLPTVMKQPLTQPTIGDRLDAKGVSWRWYAGGWSAGKDAVAAGALACGRRRWTASAWARACRRWSSRRTRAAAWWRTASTSTPPFSSSSSGAGTSSRSPRATAPPARFSRRSTFRSRPARPSRCRRLPMLRRGVLAGVLLAFAAAGAPAAERVADPTRAFVDGYDPSQNDFFANTPERTVLLRIRDDLDGDGVAD